MHFFYEYSLATEVENNSENYSTLLKIIQSLQQR